MSKATLILKIKRRFGCVPVLIALSSHVAAQTLNVKSVETTAGVTSQLVYYASGNKDCLSSPPPSIRVITAPKQGMLTIKRGALTTNKVPGCPGLQTPANVIFYTGNTGYTGDDEIVYEVKDSKGEVAIYDIKIVVKPSDKPKGSTLGSQPGQPL